MDTFIFTLDVHFPLLRNDCRLYSEPAQRLCPCENLQYVYLLVCLSRSAVKLPKQLDFAYTLNPSYEQQTSGTVSVVAVCITVASSLSLCCRRMHCWNWIESLCCSEYQQWQFFSKRNRWIELLCASRGQQDAGDVKRGNLNIMLVVVCLPASSDAQVDP